MDFQFAVADLNWLALLTAVAAYMLIGSLWFGPLFGRAWAKEMDLDGSGEAAPPQPLARAMLLMLTGAVLLAFVLRFAVAALTPAYWHPGGAALGWTGALAAGFWAWTGCFVPVQLGRVAWERRSWRLFWINSIFYLVILLTMASILGLWV